MSRRAAWIVAEDLAAPIRDVAVRTLRHRFETVGVALVGACGPRHDADAVHRLRVATRRTIAAVDAFRELIPHRQRAWFTKRLRRLRRAAGAARDLDVLGERLARHPDAERSAGNAARRRLVAMLSRQRAGSRTPIHEARDRLRAGDWQGHVDRLVDAVARAPHGDETFEDFARRRFRRLVSRFFHRVDRRLHGADEIHELRIEGKKLRYALEIFAPVFPDRVTRKCMTALERLQEQLGEFTDHAAAADRLRRWARQDGVEADRTAIIALRQAESADADLARRRFEKWWSPSRRRALRRRFSRIRRWRTA
jgi:CHAD domain-containing protein